MHDCIPILKTEEVYMRAINRVNAYLMKAIEILSVALLCSIALMIGIQVVSRIVGIGLQWPEEMSRFAFVGVIFCGSVLALHQNKHIVVDMLITKVGRVPRLILEIIAQMFVIGFCAFAVKGILLTIASAVGVHANSLIWFNYSYLYYLVFASLILMILEAVINIVGLAVAIASGKGETE